MRQSSLSTLFNGFLFDRGALNGAFDDYTIDAGMHFAGLIKVGESVDDPQIYYRNNVVGTLNLLQTMQEHGGVNRMIFSSSAAVYGDPEVIPIPESHPKCPKNPYGKTKWMTEQILEDYTRAYGSRYIAFRYFNAAGCDPEGELGENHHPETHLIPIVLDAALGRRDCITVFGTDYDTPDGTCVRDYIHVNDLAKTHILALEALKKGFASRVYNLGIGKGYSVREVIEVCQTVTGKKINVAEGARRLGDPPQLMADRSYVQKELGWEAGFTDLKEISETAWAWHRCRS